MDQQPSSCLVLLLGSTEWFSSQISTEVFLFAFAQVCTAWLGIYSTAKEVEVKKTRVLMSGSYIDVSGVPNEHGIAFIYRFPLFVAKKKI